MTRSMLLAACAAASLVAGYAGAQTTDAGATPPADQTTAADIVVTAQGRAQALADVPVAISAVNSESLALSGATTSGS